MADFYQHGAITTLHRLHDEGFAFLERELEDLAETTRIGLVLPALYTEFQHPAMHRIAAELSRVRYLRRIVVALGRAGRAEYEHACSFFRGFETPVTVLWVEDGPVQGFLELLRRKGIDTAEEGKGRSCWLACGWLLAAGDCDVLALHDCDIRNYSRGLLARLCYPAAHPDLAFEYCKGYYARVAGRLHGRVTRLFVTPLVRALENLAPGSPFLQYLDSFRYPLAGEFAMRAALAGSCRFPADWGFEIGMLAEVYRRAGLDRVCQVELTDTYDHKHQPLSADDASRGLRRMTREIAVRLLAAMGTPNGLSKSVGGQLPGRYRRLAMDIVRRHSADARLNHLAFDPAAEEAAIHVFSESLAEALASYEHAPALIPSWDEVCRTVPEAFDLLRGCAEPLPAIPPPAPISWAVTAKAPAPIAPHGSHAYHRAR